MIVWLALLSACVWPVSVSAKVESMPEVSEEMFDASFWTQDIEDADEILADNDTIKQLNEAFLSCKDCNMNDLESQGGTFDGKKANLDRWKAALSDLSKYLDGKHYDQSGEIIDGDFILNLLINLDDPYASPEEEVRYGIIVNRSDVRAYPTYEIIADDPGDNDFDNVQNSGVRVGEPVVVLASSFNEDFYLCLTSCVSGWIPSEDVAICANKKEWLSAWKFDSDDVMVVTDSKIMLERSNTSPELSGLVLTMGTVLQKVHPNEYEKMITNRSTYYNYPVWIPVRDEEGMYDRRQALISMHHSLSDGYVPLTSNNIVRQAYAMLGDTYGWGGMLASADCSSYIRDVYKCFGLELPRNTTWQSAMPAEKYDITLADTDDRKFLLDTLLPGTILFFKGHEMIYLGSVEDKYYVISSTSSMMDPETDEKMRVRSIVINTLDAKRANGNTWMDDLFEALVPYVPNEDNIITPVFSIEPAPEEDDTNEADEAEDESGEYEKITFDETWEYAKNSAIHEGSARLYKSDAVNRKDKTICINAGHGTKGGSKVKTLCHPDGSPKIVSGSTKTGATESTAISDGATMANGHGEAEATLKAAMVVKEELLREGYDVLMIRETDDVQLDNIARTLIANHFADAHIALHYDSTDTDKGVFYCSVPDDKDYKAMEPVASCWRLHEKLGKSLVYGLTREGFAKFNNGSLAMDLTQTSYSTIPSVDLEIGDTVSDTSYSALVRVSEGITKGLDLFFLSQKDKQQ